MLTRAVLILALILPLAAATPEALRAHVSFLASDLLEGRNTPSRGLDLAAAYIKSQFQIIGLRVEEQVTTWSMMRNACLPPPLESACGFAPAPVRNVIGVLPGTGNEYVLVTAHYDHLGVKAPGANDNASGVAGMIEIARGLKGRKPRRTIVFIAYFGEEKGLWGSRYYARHPLFPIAKTVAQINLEQLGRTDDVEGARLAAANLTGWDRSNVGPILAAAMAPVGVKLFKHPQFSEKFFYASDNEALSRAGVPAHTVSVAYMFPDYHKEGDVAEKLDYRNMALITRAIRAGVWSLATRLAVPRASGLPIRSKRSR